jgi:hypothetical protein
MSIRDSLGGETFTNFFKKSPNNPNSGIEPVKIQSAGSSKGYGGGGGGGGGDSRLSTIERMTNMVSESESERYK